MKFEMMKVYDRLEWSFIFDVLQRFGFSSSFSGIIKNCISSVWFWYSVLVNGSLRGFFQGEREERERGVRQGDPLSPCIFILDEEVLSRGFKRLFEDNPRLCFPVGRHAPIVSHLLYADDTLIFCNGKNLFGLESFSLFKSMRRY